MAENSNARKATMRIAEWNESEIQRYELHKSREAAEWERVDRDIERKIAESAREDNCDQKEGIGIAIAFIFAVGVLIGVFVGMWL
jgi:hypothetical protein